MKKDDFVKKIDDAGDAVVTYRSQNSRRMKYNVCTRDFDNKYIQARDAEGPQADDSHGLGGTRQLYSLVFIVSLLFMCLLIL